MKHILILGLVLLAACTTAFTENEMSEKQRMEPGNNEDKMMDKDDDMTDKALKLIQEAIQEIVDSGILENSVKIGDKAPLFDYINFRGKRTYSKNLLRKGPLVISFFRGTWCPFCNLELLHLKGINQKVQYLGGKIISISSQMDEANDKLKEKNKLPFEVVSDTKGIIAKKFQVLYKIPTKYKRALSMLDINLNDYQKINELPISATIIISKEKRVVYTYINIDYTERAEPGTIVKVLTNLKK